MSFLTQPTIYNIVLTDADTEYALEIPRECTRFRIQPRGNTEIKLSYQQGRSGDLYWTIRAAPARYYEEDRAINVPTIYLQSSVAGAIVEVLTWN